MPSYELSVIEQKGLDLNQNKELPQAGTLEDCKNISLQQLGVYSSRRGFQLVLNPLRGTGTNLSIHDIKHVETYHEGLLIYTVEGLYYADEDAFNNPPISLSDTNLVRLGDIGETKNYFHENSFFFYEAGKYKKAVVNSSNSIEPNIYNATINKPPAPLLTSLGDSGWLGQLNEVAYRVAWIRETPDGITYRSSPSERLEVQNGEADSKTPNLTIIPPSDAQSGDKIEVYRSEITQITADVGTASDELFLIQTIDFTTGSNQFSDTNSSRGGVALYTNATQEGIFNTNTPPPLADNIFSEYNGMTLYSNITEKAVAVIDVLNNFTVGDNVILNTTTNQTFIAITSGSNVPNGFVVVPNNTVKTLENLVYLINTTEALNSSIVASVLEGQGRISFVIEALTESSFDLSSTSASWKENLTEVKTYESNQYKNRIAFSKAYYPMGVPAGRVLDVGNDESKIVNISESNGILYVFKEDGIFRISGSSYDNLSVRKISSDIIVGKKAIGYYKNSIYVLCNTGLNRVNYENVQEISQTITPVLREKDILSNIDLSVVLGNENERQLFLCYPANETSQDLSDIYVYNFETGEWTKWEFSFKDTLVYDNKMVFLKNEGLFFEKKTGLNSDYSDLDLKVSLNSRITTETYTHTVDTQFFDHLGLQRLTRRQGAGGVYDRLDIDITGKTPISIKLKNVSDLSGQLGLHNEREITDLENSQYSNQGAHLDIFDSITITGGNRFLGNNIGWKIEQNNLYIWSFLAGKLQTDSADIININPHGTEHVIHDGPTIEEYNNFVLQYGEQTDIIGTGINMISGVQGFVTVPITFEIEVVYRSNFPTNEKSGLLLDEANITNAKGNTALTISSVDGNNINGLGIFGRFLGNTYHAKIGGQLRSLTRINEITNFSLDGDDLTSILTVLEFDEAIEETSDFYAFLFNPENTTPEVINIYELIPREILYHSIPNSPLMVKLLYYIQFVFEKTDTDDWELSLETNTTGKFNWLKIPIERSGLGFGLEAWGTDAWNGESNDKSYKKISVPENFRRYYSLQLRCRDYSINKSVIMLGFSLGHGKIPQDDI